jgi:hypothetical protein
MSNKKLKKNEFLFIFLLTTPPQEMRMFPGLVVGRDGVKRLDQLRFGEIPQAGGASLSGSLEWRQTLGKTTD